MISNHKSVKLPYYFYDINAILPDGRQRWADEFADASPNIIRPGIDTNVFYQEAKRLRNEAYARWQASFFVRTDEGFKPLFKPKQMIWQVVQILTDKHSEQSSLDWWPLYQDALFRVFVSPETIYDKTTKEYKQWYMLSPEDAFLVNRHEIEKGNSSLPPRDYFGDEKYLSADKRLRKARFVPTECCRHWRHETTAGQLPEGL